MVTGLGHDLLGPVLFQLRKGRPHHSSRLLDTFKSALMTGRAMVTTPARNVVIPVLYVMQQMMMPFDCFEIVLVSSCI